MFPPDPHDLAITFVDWNPMPPDKGMGLWRDVYGRGDRSGGAALSRRVHEARPAAADVAQLTVRAELRNASAAP